MGVSLKTVHSPTHRVQLEEHFDESLPFINSVVLVNAPKDVRHLVVRSLETFTLNHVLKNSTFLS